MDPNYVEVKNPSKTLSFYETVKQKIRECSPRKNIEARIAESCTKGFSCNVFTRIMYVQWVCMSLRLYFYLVVDENGKFENYHAVFKLLKDNIQSEHSLIIFSAMSTFTLVTLGIHYFWNYMIWHNCSIRDLFKEVFYMNTCSQITRNELNNVKLVCLLERDKMSYHVQCSRECEKTIHFCIVASGIYFTLLGVVGLFGILYTCMDFGSFFCVVSIIILIIDMYYLTKMMITCGQVALMVVFTLIIAYTVFKFQVMATMKRFREKVFCTKRCKKTLRTSKYWNRLQRKDSSAKAGKTLLQHWQSYELFVKQLNSIHREYFCWIPTVSRYAFIAVYGSFSSAVFIAILLLYKNIPPGLFLITSSIEITYITISIISFNTLAFWTENVYRGQNLIFKFQMHFLGCTAPGAKTTNGRKMLSSRQHWRMSKGYEMFFYRSKFFFRIGPSVTINTRNNFTFFISYCLYILNLITLLRK